MLRFTTGNTNHARQTRANRPQGKFVSQKGATDFRLKAHGRKPLPPRKHVDALDPPPLLPEIEDEWRMLLAGELGEGAQRVVRHRTDQRDFAPLRVGERYDRALTLVP